LVVGPPWVRLPGQGGPDRIYQPFVDRHLSIVPGVLAAATTRITAMGDFSCM